MKHFLSEYGFYLAVGLILLFILFLTEQRVYLLEKKVEILELDSKIVEGELRLYHMALKKFQEDYREDHPHEKSR